MANEYEIFEFLEEDKAETDKLKKMQRKILRDQCDLFELDDSEFVKRYRLTKDLANNLCEELKPLLRKPKKTTDLSVETKVLTALSFFANGSYQRPISASEGHSMAQQTVSSIISEVTTAFNDPDMRQKYIHFPGNDQERNRTKIEFYNKFQIPGVLGCIDCTHVAIIRPQVNEERYYCRKHYHSLNVQLICDSNMQITSVDASHGGATHDSFIWSHHPIQSHLEEISNFDNIWLLGDSGYPLRRTMMTPILNATAGTTEAHYTHLHVRARNTIERAIGLLKARFRCLLVHRVLHYSPEVAGRMVNACVILHNICNRSNTPVPQFDVEDLSYEIQSQHHSTENPHSNNLALQQGYASRSALIQQLWERRRI